MKLSLFSVLSLCCSPLVCTATTTLTNTRPEVAQMAALWEVDSLQISGLADAQYPEFGTDLWQYIFPHANISADGDIHIDMAVDSSGYGSTNNNAGESPLISEVINATGSQLAQLQSLAAHQVKMRGIFRMYTEHAAERHFELHPVTASYTNDGTTFGLLTDYRANIGAVDDGTSHPPSTLTNLFDGSQTVTATVLSDNNRVVFTYPSPSVNYVQYDGVALSGLLTDGVSPFFWFSPDLIPSATVRCRLVTNTPPADLATGLVPGRPLTVNALTRTDMLVISKQVAALGPNQSNTFARPVELITLGLTLTTPSGQLAVGPATGLASSGAMGGPFSPNAQVYWLTNTGTATVNWLLNKTADWLALSAGAGSLDPGTFTNVTVSLNTNAANLPAGTYYDTVSLINASTGVGNTTRPVSLTVSADTNNPTFGIFDDFAAFSAGNLVGQHDWGQAGTSANLPLQVTNGQVVIPAGQTTDNQDAFKNFPQTSTTIFYGLLLSVNSAVTNTSPSYFAALFTSNNAAGFANFRLTARAGTAAATNFTFGLRITGQAGDPYSFGAALLNTGVQYMVIVQAPAGGTAMSVYVNPTSGDVAGQTPYAVNSIGSGTPPPALGSLVLSQFGSGTVPSDGLTLAKAAVGDTFAAVYSFLAGLTPFQAWQVQFFGSTNNPAAAPTADPDGDGADNYAEYRAGTNPTNSASVFRITALGLEGTNVRLTWSTGPGRTNIVQRATTLTSGVPGGFTNLASLFTTGTLTNFLDTGAATNSALFYRLSLGP